MYDLVLNDDGIFEDAQPFFVRQFYVNCKPIVNAFIEILVEGDLKNY